MLWIEFTEICKSIINIQWMRYNSDVTSMNARNFGIRKFKLYSKTKYNLRDI